MQTRHKHPRRAWSSESLVWRRPMDASCGLPAAWSALRLVRPDQPLSAVDPPLKEGWSEEVGCCAALLLILPFISCCPAGRHSCTASLHRGCIDRSVQVFVDFWNITHHACKLLTLFWSTHTSARSHGTLKYWTRRALTHAELLPRPV
jgi:hypothetical protein